MKQIEAPHSLAEAELRSHLEKNIGKAIEKFPRLLDKRLFKGLDRIVVNASSHFLTSRCIPHLQKLLITQFFLQKRIEASLQHEGVNQHPLFLRTFCYSFRIGIAFAFLDTYRFRRDQLIKTLQLLVPGIQEIPHSFYLWHHPELPYIFCYLEVHKLRGEELSMRGVKKLEHSLREQLHATPPLTPTLFWPYNEEESFRQVQLLLKEMHHADDLPHISLHFQEQTPSSLEFLIHMARPKTSESLAQSLGRLPDYLDYFCHFQHNVQHPFPIELGAFAIKVPSHAFDVRESINLLYARRYVLKYLEDTFGPCRDYNGGLFEKQQQHFETIRALLSDKIPLFDLFAERVFYALLPVERRLMLTLTEAENLFRAFSDLVQGKGTVTGKYDSESVTIVKAAHQADLPRLNHITKESKKKIAHARLSFGGYYYHCVLGSGPGDINTFLQESASSRENTKTLRLVFEEGQPTSLNPYHTAGDMRCRLLCKLLFEGLFRLNAQGNPEPAGAASFDLSQNGTVYQFKLRPNRWSNGERVTAIDYATSLKKALRGLLSHPEVYFAIKNAKAFKEKNAGPNELGIHAISPDTLQIELERPDARFLHHLAKPFFFPLFGSMQEPIWFNGPYLIREKNKEGIQLQRNPYFWNAKRIFFEEVNIRWHEDSTAYFPLFQEGKMNWIGDPLNTLTPVLIRQLEHEGKLLRQEACRRFLVYFNTKHPILASTWIRKALSLAIDRSLICSDIFIHSSPLFPLLPDKEEANVYFERGLRELGLTRETFPALTFSYSHQARREKLALCLQSVWQETLGMKIVLKEIEWNLFRNRLEKGNFEITGTIQDIEEEDAPRYLERFEGFNTWNFSNWHNLEYRKLVAKAHTETEEIQRQALLADAKQILTDEVPFTPLFKYTHLFAHSPNLRGYLFDEEGCVDFSQSHF